MSAGWEGPVAGPYGKVPDVFVTDRQHLGLSGMHMLLAQTMQMSLHLPLELFQTRRYTIAPLVHWGGYAIIN